MPANPFSFAQRLKTLRVNKHLSKTALAGLVGVSITCVWNWEEGNTEPRSENLDSLSKVLDVPIEYLRSGSGMEDSVQIERADDTVSLAEIIADAKIRIASLAGIAPEEVKISLSY